MPSIIKAIFGKTLPYQSQIYNQSQITGNKFRIGMVIWIG